MSFGYRKSYIKYANLHQIIRSFVKGDFNKHRTVQRKELTYKIRHEVLHLVAWECVSERGGL